MFVHFVFLWRWALVLWIQCCNASQQQILWLPIPWITFFTGYRCQTLCVVIPHTLGISDQLTCINTKLVLITKLEDADPLTAGQSKHWKYPNDFQLMWNTDSMRDRLNRGAELTEDPDINPNVKFI